MGLTNNFLTRNKLWILASLIGLNATLFIHKPANSFIPYVFNPKANNLEEASINFGKTAAQLIHFGQIEEANRLAKLAVRLNPNDSRLWSILAEAQARNKLFKEASQSLIKAKKIEPKNAQLWFADGSLNLRQNNPKNAIIMITKGLTIDPNNANAYFQLGNARMMQSQFILALKAFKNATKIKPKFWEALNNQALVHYELGNTKKAIIMWRNVLKIEENSEPMLALASALNQMQSISQESLDLAKKALSKNPNYVSSQHQAEQLWGKKLRQAAQELLKHPNLNDDVKRALANSN
ncbi:tetratricopeptide repeat protein [Prochlorococcus sp. MIT 1307]|uniref:tetratricopeptide repeat protein n=1 Tax=Prochlorococcus sp. MIT 1307 TaxID=3096219 RepID=UPI002A766821|nr:tetratricopeptide repeat protein [Prochlorococcus sp. MIT 1307]